MRRNNWKWLCLIAACVLVPCLAMAQGLEMAEPLEGTEYFPQGAGEEQAVYRYSYSFPQFGASAPSDEAINQYYQATRDNLLKYSLTLNAEELLEQWEEGAPMFYSHLQYQVTANTGEYLSVVLTTTQFAGNGESESIEANVFARDGVYAGQAVTLTQVMGMEQESGNGVGSASELVYPLVWQIIQQEQAGLRRDYLENSSEERLQTVFSPETDFYMDEDGNLVFFIQAGLMAGEVEGVLTYPFSMAELLTAVKNRPN